MTFRVRKKCTRCERRRMCAQCDSCGERYCDECSRQLKQPESQVKPQAAEKWLCVDCEEEAQAYAAFGVWGSL